MLKGLRNAGSETKKLFTEAFETIGTLRRIRKTDKKRFPKYLIFYFKKALRKHSIVFTYAMNTVLPVIAFLILVATIHYWSETTFALEVKYKDSTVGYVSNEEVYLAAENEAQQRLDVKSGSGQDTVSQASYKLKTVNISELNDASTICDRLMESSDSNITNACGIYIDDEFLCAVKNETDAVSVFDKLLEPYQTDEDNTTVGFVEKVEYVQGLYSDTEGIIWEADVLRDRLNTTKEEAEYYTVEAGDTISGIA